MTGFPWVNISASKEVICRVQNVFLFGSSFQAGPVGLGCGMWAKASVSTPMEMVVGFLGMLGH